MLIVHDFSIKIVSYELVKCVALSVITVVSIKTVGLMQTLWNEILSQLYM